jgi:hypothetical protein
MMATVVLGHLFGEPLPSDHIAKAMLFNRWATGSRSAISPCPLVGLPRAEGSSMAEQALLVPVTLLALLIALAALLRN